MICAGEPRLPHVLDSHMAGASCQLDLRPSVLCLVLRSGASLAPLGLGSRGADQVSVCAADNRRVARQRILGLMSVSVAEAI